MRTPSIGRSDARDRILRTLAWCGSASRAELARRTSLAPSTVSVVIAELIAEGLVTSGEDSLGVEITARVGRPATRLALHRSAGVVVGLDMSRQGMRAAVVDLAHRVLAESDEEIARDRPAAEAIGGAAALVARTLESAGAEAGDVLGVGVGLPGPLHAPTGELGDSMILPGWAGVKATEALTEALKLPVTVDNDANFGAMGEWMWGAGRGCDDLAYLKLSTGIGAGLILNGRPFVGSGGTAGEIGHTMIDPNGPVCRCGNRGCLEMLAGADALVAALRSRRDDDLTIRGVVDLALDGDMGCRRAIADAGRSIGVAAASLCNLINPRRIVIGGELATAGSLLLEPLRQALDGATIRSAAADVEVLQGRLGEKAGVLGAAAAAYRRAGRTYRAAAS